MDLAAHFTAQCNRHAVALEIGNEFTNGLVVRPVEADVIVVIDGNGIDENVFAAEEAGQFFGTGMGTGQIFNENIFKGDFAPCLFK